MARSASAWKGFERNVAKAISVWWCGDENAFVRTACSGAWPRARSDGDVVGSTEDLRREFPFVVDAKQRKYSGGKTEWRWEQLLTSPKHVILDWWRELDNIDLVKQGKKKFLVISRTGVGNAFLMIGDDEFDFIRSATTSILAVPRFSFHLGGSEDPNFTPDCTHVFQFKAFMSIVDAGAIRRLRCVQ